MRELKSKLRRRTLANPEGGLQPPSLVSLLSQVEWALDHEGQFFQKYVDNLWETYAEAAKCMTAVLEALVELDEEGNTLIRKMTKERCVKCQRKVKS